MRRRRVLLAAGACAGCLAVTAAAPTAAPRLDYAGAAWSILPTGEDGGLTLTKHSTDQAKLYDALTPKAGNVSAADLPRDLKPERLSPVGRTTVELIPRNRLRALRDRFGVAQPPSAEPPPPLGSRSLAEKRYLMTPGPTPVPPQVLAALAQPVVHHRGPDFRAVLASTLERLRRVHRTKGDVLLFTASGTAAMESAAANLLAPGDRVLVVSAGYFGERWAKITRAYGADVQQLAYEWGETPSPDDLAARLVELGDVKAVFLTQSETSTGVVADVQALAASAKEAGKLVVVDAISSLGAVPLETEAWGIDVVAGGSQKALMTPPGLATVAVSEEAWAAVSDAAPRFYLDWAATRKAHAAVDTPFTPATSLVAALDVALGLLLDEGLDAAFERHVRLGRACREGVKAMGLELFSPDDDASSVVTAIRAPEGVDSGELVLALRDRFGITLAPGQGVLKGKIFRIGHIGYYDIFDITTALAGVELALAEAGAPIERGVAVTRALEAFERAPA